MRMNKKIISTLLSFAMIFPFMQPISVNATDLTVSESVYIRVEVVGVEGGWIEYDSEQGYISDAEETITSANIPSVIDGTTITGIGDAAFYGCTSLTSVTIPDSVTSIGVQAFDGCTSLKDIQVVTNNPSYSTVDGVLFTKDGSTLVAYPGGGGSHYTIPSSATSIDAYAFVGCSGLISVTIPDSVTSINSGAFSGCTSLTSVTLPSFVTTIEGYTFFRCVGLTSVKIPDSVTVIGEYAFSGCTSLTSVTIPDPVTSIGWDGFYGCTSLTSVTIPNSVTSIYLRAFSGCTSLSDVYYQGIEEQWNDISIRSGNTALTSATIHYATALTNAVQYVPYTTTLSDVDESTTLVSGSLPKGLGLFADGTISGIPTTTGIYNFTLSTGESYAITVEAGTAETVEATNNYEIIDRVPTITNNSKDQLFHIEAPFSDFLEVYLNGTKLIRDAEYSAEEGSTVITIFAQTFATESTGTHTISATFATDDSTVAQVSQQVTKTAEQVANAMPYTDVSESAWYYDYVYLMYRRGIIAGTSTTTYSPESNLTRGMMVDALYQLAGAPAATASSFTDVSADAWYADAVSWAASVGVTQGVGDNMFAPETSITREQMATMIQRYCDLMGITLPLYTSAIPTDLSAISDWAVDSATAMYQYGVLNGDEAGNFNPSGTATRAEAASMFSNFLEILDRT